MSAFWGESMSAELTNLKVQLKTLSTDLTASEVHGFITGWVSSGTAWESASEAFEKAFDLPLQGLLKEAAMQTAVSVGSGLADMDFGFHILLPDESEVINNRRVALSEWCRSFLTGFGLTGRFQQAELSDEVKELFHDFAEISQVEDEIPEDDENESDLTEITEYVRIGAIMVFTDCASKAVH